MKQLTPNIDIFCFGALLLYIVNCGYSWQSSEELTVNNLSSLLSRGNKFFHKPIYDKLEALIARCLMVFDPKFKGQSFMSFKEIKAAVLREFGYFIDRINNNHPKAGVKDTSPIHESNLSKFKRSLG